MINLMIERYNHSSIFRENVNIHIFLGLLRHFRLRLKSANSFWECGGIGRRAGLKIRRAL